MYVRIVRLLEPHRKWLLTVACRGFGVTLSERHQRNYIGVITVGHQARHARAGIAPHLTPHVQQEVFCDPPAPALGRVA